MLWMPSLYADSPFPSHSVFFLFVAIFQMARKSLVLRGFIARRHACMVFRRFE